MHKNQHNNRFNLMRDRAAHTNIANYDSDNSKENVYDMGVIGNIPSILTVTLTGDANCYFKNHINFIIPAFPNRSGFAYSYSLNLLGIHAEKITGFSVEVWKDAHLGRSTLHTTLPGCAVTNFLGHLPAGPYHLGICGHRESTAQVGRYSVALQALPVPEPTAYALLLASLSWARRTARRRKFA